MQCQEEKKEYPFDFLYHQGMLWFALESSYRRDSNEYTQYTIFSMKKKNTLNYPKSVVMVFFPKGLKNEFETAVVNEPPVFQPLKLYCIMIAVLWLDT